MKRGRILRNAEPERLWVSVLVFLVALSIAALLSVDDVDSARPLAPEFQP